MLTVQVSTPFAKSAITEIIPNPPRHRSSNIRIAHDGRGERYLLQHCCELPVVKFSYFSFLHSLKVITTTAETTLRM